MVTGKNWFRKVAFLLKKSVDAPSDASVMCLGNLITRQLPMGAGHCQWGGFTDRNVCNIPKLRPLGPLAAEGERVTHGRKARKYIMMICDL